jgi:hypothetical protein
MAAKTLGESNVGKQSQSTEPLTPISAQVKPSPTMPYFPMSSAPPSTSNASATRRDVV